MENPICVSTGLVYKLSEDMNERIGLLSGLPIDGVELNFADSEFLLNFEMSPETLVFLKKFKFNSIHSPWRNIEYGENQNCHKVLNKIQQLYNEIGARNVVVHTGELKDSRVFDGYAFTVSLENEDWRKGYSQTPDEMSENLSKNSKFLFTFDFAHALTAAPEEVPNFISKFKDKIVQVHTAYLSKELRDHYFLFCNDSEKIRTKLSGLSNLSVPLVLESVANSKEDVQNIRKEIEYLRSI